MAKIYYGNQEISNEQYIDSEHLNDNAVTTSKVQDGAITENKLSADVQEKLNSEGVTNYDDLTNKPVINIKVESETDLYTGLKDAENGMMIRVTTVPAEYITDNTLYAADSHWYLRLIPFYATYDEAEHRFTLIDQCVETYTVPGHDFDTVVGKLASGTIVVNGQTESVALSLSQATDHDTGEILVDGLILTGDYQDHPEDAPEYQILFNSHTGIRTAELTLNYDVEFDTIIDQNVLDQIVSVTLEQNGYYTIDALNTRDGLSLNEVLDKTKLKTINGTSVVGSGDIKVTTFQPFNSSWPTSSSYTTSQFCQAVNDDTNAIVGMAYLGGAKWSDMPSGLSNCDVVVEVLQGPNANTKSIHLIITSGSVAPYTWEYTWWSGSSPKGWVSFKSSIVAGNNVQLSDDSSHRLVISATDTTYTNGNGLNLSGTEFSVDTSVIATQSDLQGKQDVLTAGANITIDSNNEISATDTTYSAGNGLSLNGTEFSVDTTVVATQQDLAGKQDTLTAGSNVTINNNEISATDTTYSAGSGLSLSGTEFSVDTTTIQEKLVSGTNIKTINSESLLGSGNIQIQGITDYNDLQNKPIINQDLEAVNFTPTADTYYRHTGTTNTYISGAIYFYDGTSYRRVIDTSMVDTVPTQGSTNLITSGAVYAALGDIEARLAQI